MSQPNRKQSTATKSNRRGFLKSATGAAALPIGLSIAGNGAVAGPSTETVDFSPQSVDDKPYAVRSDSAATTGTGGYSIQNSGELIYHYSFPRKDLNGDVTAWRHRFTIEGFGFTIRHTGNDYDYYFGHTLGDISERLGQYVSLESESGTGLYTNHGAGSNGWYHPEDVWDGLEEVIGGTNYSIPEVAEELHWNADIGMVEQFFDEEYESAGDDVKTWVEHEADVPSDQEDDHAQDVLMTLAGIGTAFVPAPYGTGISLGMAAADVAGTAYEASSGSEDDFVVIEEEVDVNDFEGSVKYPSYPDYLTIDDWGPSEFDGYGTPVRGHHINFEIETPTGSWWQTWDVEVESGFATEASDWDEYSTLTWELPLPTGGEDEDLTDVSNRVQNEMSNINVEFDHWGNDHGHESKLLTY